MNQRGTRACTRNYIKNYGNKVLSCKRSVSPVIATILLIALVIIIALIVFQWMKGFTKEAITKSGGTNIELVCDDVQIDASYSGGTLTISNLGNVPIYNFNIKAEYSGGHETDDLETKVGSEKWNGLNQGGVFSEEVLFNTAPTTITLIPILLGVNKDGEQKTQTCEERQGREIFV